MADGVSLLFPPAWYYVAVPADLSWTAGFLAGNGVRVTARDLSARLARHLLGDRPGWATLRTWEGCRTGRTGARADLEQAAAAVSRRHRVHYGLRHLRFPDVCEAHLPEARRAGLDPRRNPALPVLEEAAREVVAEDPAVVGVALVHPDQRVQALALGTLLRCAGFRGTLALYGALEDVLSPLDLAEDLVGRDHLLFDDFDLAVVGEAESALLALARGAAPPNVVRRGQERLPPRHVEDLAAHPGPDFAFVRPEDHCTPVPVVDLRLGRGCPWGRCAFCAIQAHQPGYRSGGTSALAGAMKRAGAQLGTSCFRIRDDLLTPRQLGEVSDAVAPLGARWTARARFEPGLGRRVLSAARDAGLEELWLGLESASDRVRAAMDKGVRGEVVEQVLADCEAAGIRVRVLCMLGFPGETEAEARETLGFLEANQERIASCALTPFQLQRRSPLAGDPARWGLTIRPPVLPASARLEPLLQADGPLLPPEVLARLLAEARTRLAPMVAREAGPALEHDWLGSGPPR